MERFATEPIHILLDSHTDTSCSTSSECPCVGQTVTVLWNIDWEIETSFHLVSTNDGDCFLCICGLFCLFAVCLLGGGHSYCFFSCEFLVTFAESSFGYLSWESCLPNPNKNNQRNNSGHWDSTYIHSVIRMVTSYMDRAMQRPLQPGGKNASARTRCPAAAWLCITTCKWCS